IKSFIAFTVFLKAFGGLLFIIRSSFGAFVLVSANIGNLGWQCHTLISSLSLPLPCFLKPLAVVSFSSSAARSERS
uniref:Uncharacterized protein n=1 Tax=Triticum urartu TaxID=4572 RepID=A0A8R7UDP4_TRIUA